jgi:hypothetical protein
MSNIIPTELFEIPLYAFLLSLFVPSLIIRGLFFLFNKILKAKSNVSTTNRIFSVVAWLFPLLFIMQGSFNESIAFYLLVCFFSCAVVSIGIYFLFAENKKNENG